MQDTWFWMSGDAMTFTKWPQDSAPRHYSNPCGGMARGGLFLWEDQPCEKLLNFICLSGKGYTSHPACVLAHHHNTFTSSVCPSEAVDGAQRMYFYSTNEDTSP